MVNFGRANKQAKCRAPVKMMGGGGGGDDNIHLTASAHDDIKDKFTSLFHTFLDVSIVCMTPCG